MASTRPIAKPSLVPVAPPTVVSVAVAVPAFAATIPAKSNITAVTVYTDRAVVTRTATVDLARLDAQVSRCRACPRLVEWRERVAAEER